MKGKGKGMSPYTFCIPFSAETEPMLLLVCWAACIRVDREIGREVGMSSVYYKMTGKDKEA